MYVCMHACSVLSVMSDSLQPHGLQPAKLLCPWNFPCKNTEKWVSIFSSKDLPNSGIELTSPVSLALQADSQPLSHQESHIYI